MVCNEAFLYQLMEVCADYEPKRLAVPIVHHLCWRNKPASAALINAVRTHRWQLLPPAAACSRLLPHRWLMPPPSNSLPPSPVRASSSHSQVVKGVESKDGNDLKPFFNILGVLLEMDDDEELAVRCSCFCFFFFCCCCCCYLLGARISPPRTLPPSPPALPRRNCACASP